MARQSENSRRKDPKVTVALDATVNDLIRAEGDDYGAFRGQVESALLAFLGAPKSHRDALLKYRAGCLATREAFDVDEAFRLLARGPENDQD